MKLLFDQNISQRIIDSISDIFPNAVHITELGLSNSSDFEVWDYSLKNDFVLVTCDTECVNRNVLSENSPRIICVQADVVTTNKVEWSLRVNQETIVEFINEQGPTNCLILQV